MVEIQIDKTFFILRFRAGP